MERILAIILLWGVFSAPRAVAVSEYPVETPVASSDTAPSIPNGNSTTLGGEITAIDSVRDELTLRVFGERPAKILFDERTQVYRDGKKISLHDLGTARHASVQTLLDGTNVFALSIHILSQAPEGKFQGTVLRYNSENTELTISASPLSDPIRLLVPASAHVLRQGQSLFTSGASGASDLVKGTLVDVTFRSDNKGRGIANLVTVLATPGATFVFSGNLSSLDMHTGVLVVVDPRDDKSYPISFDPAQLPDSQLLHTGTHVTVVATYDGVRYLASRVSLS